MKNRITAVVIGLVSLLWSVTSASPVLPTPVEGQKVCGVTTGQMAIQRFEHPNAPASGILLSAKEILRSKNTGCWFNAGTAIALWGSADDIQYLIRFIETAHGMPVDDRGYTAIATAHRWVGMLGNQHGNSSNAKLALDFLKRAASASQAQKRSIEWRHPLGLSAEQLKDVLRQHALMGLAHLGTNQARAELSRMNKLEAFPPAVMEGAMSVWSKARVVWAKKEVASP